MVTSMDDFYVLGSGMIVTETSNDVYDQNLYRLSTNQVGSSTGGTAGMGMPGWAHTCRKHEPPCATLARMEQTLQGLC